MVNLNVIMAYYNMSGNSKSTGSVFLIGKSGHETDFFEFTWVQVIGMLSVFSLTSSPVLDTT